jgi:hypothetical protein
MMMLSDTEGSFWPERAAQMADAVVNHLRRVAKVRIGSLQGALPFPFILAWSSPDSTFIGSLHGLALRTSTVLFKGQSLEAIG